MRLRLLPLALLAVACQQAPTPAHAQTARTALADFPTVASVVDSLRTVATADPSVRTARLDRLWTTLRSAGQIPFAVGDSVLWLYRGSAASVAWAGDHSGWDPSGQGGTNAFGLGVWMRRASFPADARLDYKIVVNGSNWILDPVNGFQQWSGFGPNSELRMPSYIPSPYTTLQPGTPRGTLGPNVRYASAALGYEVQYRVWTPADYDPNGPTLPVLYVTDGHEYADERLGGMTVVMDRLVAEKRVRPAVLVFVDPRNPANLSQNRRQTELVPPGGSSSVCNPCRGDAFLNALVSEIVPAVEASYRVEVGAGSRGVVGTSLGGLFAAYAGATRPDVFGAIGINSPAFQVYPAIYDAYRRAWQGQRVFVSQGTINDGNGGQTLVPILQQYGYDYRYEVRNEGHSWGQWNDVLPDLLPAVLGTLVLPTDDPAGVSGMTGHAYPNPARGAVTLVLTLDRPATVTATVVDAAGREATRAWDGAALGAGEHRMRLATRGLADGRYTVRFDADGRRLSVPLVVAR